MLVDCETEIRPSYFPLSIAYVPMEGWGPAAEPKHVFLNWDRDITADATAIHGIDREFLAKNGGPPGEVLASFRSDVGGLGVGSYNFNFDGDACLNPELLSHGLQPVSRELCLLNAARRLFDPSPAGNHKLQTLRAHFKAPERKAHGALDDVLTVLDLLPTFRSRAAEHGITTWPEFVAFANEEWYPSVLNFGKYRGQSVSSLKGDARFQSYCEWLEKNADVEDFRRMGRYYRNATR
jgi:DNA polymerase III epsilon subunit-like protein